MAFVARKPAVCRLCKDRIPAIDYKESTKLQRYLNEQGKILSRRTTGNCAEHQRVIATAVKRARELGIVVVPRD